MSRDLLKLVLAAAPELDPNVVVPAGFTAIATIVVAIFVFLGTRSPRKVDAPVPPLVPPSPLASFSGTQNEFMALVIRDNELVRAEVAELRGEVAELKHELEAERSDRSAFERAVRRYLERLASVWPGPDPMPWPDSPDLELIDRALPPRRGRKA